MPVNPIIHKTLCRSSISVARMSNPEFSPMLNVIFSDRVISHPSALNAFAKRSSQLLSENSRSTIVTIQSRRANSDTSVTIKRIRVANRMKTESVKTNNTKHTGGSHE